MIKNAILDQPMQICDDLQSKREIDIIALLPVQNLPHGHTIWLMRFHLQRNGVAYGCVI